jgi:hypothetical protein
VAGTIITGATLYQNITNSMGTGTGSYNDTSLSLGATTRLDTKINITEKTFAAMASMTPTQQKAEASKYLTVQGYYAIDHLRGQIWGNPKAAVADDTATYKYLTTLSGGGTGNKVDIIKIGGVAAPIQNAAFGTATPGIAVFGKYDATPDTYDDGDAVPLKMDAQGNLYVKDATLGTDVLAVTATGAVAINTTTAIAAEWKLVQVTVHFNSAPTTSQNITMTLDNITGSAYDTVLYSVNPSLSAATDIVYIPDGEFKFRSGDELAVAFTNTDTKTYGLSIYYQLI